MLVKNLDIENSIRYALLIEYNGSDLVGWQKQNKGMSVQSSLEEAAKNNNKTLTVLLIARIIGDNPLIDFDLNSLITIRNSLKSIGLDNLSKIITQEIMTSKIVNL